MVCAEIYIKISPYFYVIETPATTHSPPSSGNKPESTNNEDLFEEESIKTKEDEAVVIDDDDDDSMFDDEEFEAVIVRFRKILSTKFSLLFSLIHFHPPLPLHLILKSPKFLLT